MNKVKNAGITLKLNATILTTIFVLLVFMAVGITSNTRTMFHRQLDSSVGFLKAEQEKENTLLQNGLNKKGKAIAGLLSQVAALYIIGYDFTGLEQLAKNSMADEEIEYVVFYDKDGKALTTMPEKVNRQQAITEDIVFDNEKVGSVEVGLDFGLIDKTVKDLSSRMSGVVNEARQMDQSIVRSSVLTVVVFTVIVLLLVCAVVFVTARAITKRLQKAVNTLGKVAEGDLSEEIAVDRKDEVGQLFVSMKQMVENLQTTAGMAEQISLGNLDVEVKLLSDKDMLGKSLAKMVENLKSTARQAEQIARGDLTVQVELLSDQDTLGWSKSCGRLSMKSRRQLPRWPRAAMSLATVPRRSRKGRASKPPRLKKFQAPWKSWPVP